MKYEKSENSQWTFFFFFLNPHAPLFGFGTRKTTGVCLHSPTLPPPLEKKKELVFSSHCSSERYGIFVGLGQTFVAGQWPWAAEGASIFLPSSAVICSILADGVAFIQSSAVPFQLVRPSK